MKIISATFQITTEHKGLPPVITEVMVRNVGGHVKVAIKGEIIASFPGGSISTCDARAYDQHLVNLYGQIYGRVGSAVERAALYEELRRFA